MQSLSKLKRPLSLQAVQQLVPCTREHSPSSQMVHNPPQADGTEREGNPTKLGAAVMQLKAQLAAGLPMEQAMLITEEMDPTEKKAVELWFGTEY